ncbi:MAG: YHYH protein [Burkholderiaceae bacterium]
MVAVGCGITDSGSQRLQYQWALPGSEASTVDESLPYLSDWTCSGDLRSLSGNGVPNHSVTGGEFATQISAQNIAIDFSLSPALATGATAVKEPAYARNGVKFDPATAGTCPSSATSAADCDPAMGFDPWRMEALPGSVESWQFGFGVDSSNAHVQPNGQYHYHGMPEALLERLSGGAVTMQLVGWASDGFPLYARYGYSDPNDAGSALKVVAASYRVKAEPDDGRPSTAIFAMGHFTQDWEYVPGSGDLDECNGRTGVTPEFPEGIYHYFVTDTYPFVQRCVKGVVSAAPGTGFGPGR